MSKIKSRNAKMQNAGQKWGKKQNRYGKFKQKNIFQNIQQKKQNPEHCVLIF